MTGKTKYFHDITDIYQYSRLIILQGTIIIKRISSIC